MTQIYELVRFGGGGFTFLDLYVMPNWMRKFNYNMLLKELKDQEENNDNAPGKGKLDIPEHIKSDYSTKSRRK